jgi:hypothetical protein
VSDHKQSQQNCVNITKSATVEQATNATGTDFPTVESGTIRVPVRLGVFEVTSHLSANITFPHPALEIKDIKKRVEIVQCRLMTPAATNGTTTSDGPFPLFIKGFVRKNIQYASPCYNSSGECISSEMKSFTTRVPFQFTTLIEDLDFPAVLPVLNQRSEYDFAITKDLGPGHPEKDHFHSSDLSQFHQISTQFYNDLPYCEIVSHTINEWDEATDRELLGDDPAGEGFFHNILEKMMLSFTIRVLQVQSLDVDS